MPKEIQLLLNKALRVKSSEMKKAASSCRLPDATGMRRFRFLFAGRAARNHPRRGKRPHLYRVLSERFFPLTFLVRNFLILQREPAWKRLPLRTQKARFLILVDERCRFFNEVKEWLTQFGGGSLKIQPEQFLLLENDSPGAYCTHCGGCCELRSGLPDFPPESIIPEHWKEMFGHGLGSDHRFCPFLWEFKRTGLSFCSIHPFRSNPCRTFELEECEYLRNDPDFLSISTQGYTLRACRKLFHLLYG
jgi:hypothetical protein